VLVFLMVFKEDDEEIYMTNMVCHSHIHIYDGNALMLLAVAVVVVMLLWTLCNITQLACFFLLRFLTQLPLMKLLFYTILVT
jgi:hypothetical protein